MFSNKFLVTLLFMSSIVEILTAILIFFLSSFSTFLPSKNSAKNISKLFAETLVLILLSVIVLKIKSHIIVASGSPFFMSSLRIEKQVIISSIFLGGLFNLCFFKNNFE